MGFWFDSSSSRHRHSLARRCPGSANPELSGVRYGRSVVVVWYNDCVSVDSRLHRRLESFVPQRGVRGTGLDDIRPGADGVDLADIDRRSMR